jgi:predicted flap endonuclease-1-like 5' DNA nuclease
MSYLFLQTLILQFFVGIAFLLLGLWGGKFLWGHDRHPTQPSPNAAGGDGANKKATPAMEEELKKLRMLNGKLEKENHKLREKISVEAASVEDEGASVEVEETMEVVDMPVEPEASEPPKVKAKAEKPTKAAAKGERDELIRIRGIGKVMAETLEKRGIRTYRQIADWTKEEIAKLPYGSRVGRDKWQMQARRLHKEKYGEKL